MLIDFKPETPAYNFDQFFRDIRVFTNPANLESARDAADKSYSGQRDGADLWGISHRLSIHWARHSKSIHGVKFSFLKKRMNLPIPSTDT